MHINALFDALINNLLWVCNPGKEAIITNIRILQLILSENITIIILCQSNNIVVHCPFLWSKLLKT